MAGLRRSAQIAAEGPQRRIGSGARGGGSGVLIGSMFSGVGGLELGLEMARVGTTGWQAERDEFCRSVLRRHWPNTRIYEDVRSIGEEVPAVDVLCAGFPCQDISVAGKGKGLEGERSGLFFEVVRVLRLLHAKRSGAFVVLENVPAITSRGLGAVLGELANLGYDARWQVLSAQEMGAPQIRKRWFLVARHREIPYAKGRELGPRLCAGEPGRERGGRSSHLRGEDLAHTNRGGCVAKRKPKQAGIQSERGSEPDGRGEARPERVQDRRTFPPGPHDVHLWGKVPDDAKPGVCRVAHGISAGMGHREQLRALGNAVVPQCAEVIGRLLLEWALAELNGGQRG